MSAWAEWVVEVAGTDTSTVIAKATGINQSSIYRWLNEDAVPTPAHAAKVAQSYGREVLEAFVAAGFLTAEEAGLGDPLERELANELASAAALREALAHAEARVVRLRNFIDEKRRLTVEAGLIGDFLADAAEGYMIKGAAASGEIVTSREGAEKVFGEVLHRMTADRSADRVEVARSMLTWPADGFLHALDNPKHQTFVGDSINSFKYRLGRIKKLAGTWQLPMDDPASQEILTYLLGCLTEERVRSKADLLERFSKIADDLAKHSTSDEE